MRVLKEILADGPLAAGNVKRFAATAGVAERTLQRARHALGVTARRQGFGPGGHEDYSSPEQRATDFLTFTLRPWLHRLERAISSLLPRTQVAKFNAGAMVRADLKTRYEAHAIALASGFLTVNEVRELEDRGPLPEGGAVA